MRFTITLDIPKIQVEVPALDRLIDYLEGKQQAEIDELKARFSATNSALQAALLQNTPKSEVHKNQKQGE